MFEGFDDSESLTPVPDSFFRKLLAQISDADELKVTLYVLWRISHMESKFQTLCRSEIVEDEAFMRGISVEALDSGLEKSVGRGSLLRVENPEGGFYFINSPRGRAAAEAMRKGEWREAARSTAPPLERPNVFRLYEENIGPLTPLLADALKDAEGAYPEEWIAEAVEEAVKRNKRSWKYVEAILKRWKEEGRAQKQDRRDAKEGRQRSIERKIEELRKRSR
jgi:DNA replication protein